MNKKASLISKITGISLAVLLSLSVLVGCGSSDTTGSTDTTSGEQQSESAEGEAEFDAQAALDTLLAANPAESNYLVLSGLAGGWAPTVMVLDNDGNFVALVDYAGQATVNFATGTYEEKADGSITATGTQYNTGEEVVYEISLNGDTYSVELEVPDTGATGTLTGAKA
ncbi:MAG TPA: hypothetical protein PK071_00415 [Atopobiaceae bacterium]|nr:hypothetical protein [Atopobiaceae bacterium]